MLTNNETDFFLRVVMSAIYTFPNIGSNVMVSAVTFIFA